MDLSYTDTSFHPIYSLQGISQSVLEVTIEMKQKTLFKYYYLLLWIMNYVMNYERLRPSIYANVMTFLSRLIIFIFFFYNKAAQ